MCATPQQSSRLRRLFDKLELHRRGLVFLLTTSPRTRANMRDTSNNRKYAEMERARVQWMNDVFMSAGREGRTDSADERTMEKGLEGSFFIPISFLLWLMILTIAYFGTYGRKENAEKLTAALDEQFLANQAQMEKEEAKHKEVMALAADP